MLKPRFGRQGEHVALNLATPGEIQRAYAEAGPEAPCPAGVTDLTFSAPTLAAIFDGKIKTWNDAAIKADNPSATLPSTPVSVVYRADSSGTNAVFTAYLAAAAPKAWTLGSGKTIQWPTGTGAQKSAIAEELMTLPRFGGHLV